MAEDENRKDEKINTFIEGLDEVLGGGIPKGSIVLVSGAPGTMKSSLCYNILFNQARYGHRGLYFSFEQDNITQQMESLGMCQKDSGPNLKVLDVSEMRYALDSPHLPIKRHEAGKEDVLGLDFYYMELQKTRRTYPYELLAIDSLDAIECIAGITNRRYEMFYLFRKLRDLKATVFLISEAVPDMNCSSRGYEEGFLADGIIHLSLQTVNEVESQRRIRCIKMRGTKHSTDHFAFMYEDGKFIVSKLMRH